MMRKALLCAVALSAMAAPAAAVVTYKFTALSSFNFDLNNGDGPQQFSGSFQFTVPSAISTDTTIPAASLTSCSYIGSISGVVPCASQDFLFGIVPGNLTVSFGTPGIGIYYYFNAAASTTAGTWNTVIFGASQQGILETSFGSAVPEPASWAMLIAGFGLVGAMRRRQRSLAA